MKHCYSITRVINVLKGYLFERNRAFARYTVSRKMDMEKKQNESDQN